MSQFLSLPACKKSSGFRENHKISFCVGDIHKGCPKVYKAFIHMRLGCGKLRHIVVGKLNFELFTTLKAPCDVILRRVLLSASQVPHLIGLERDKFRRP